MRVRISNIFMIVTVAICFFWDMMEKQINRLPLVAITVILFLFIIVYKKIRCPLSIIVVSVLVLIHGIINIGLHNDDATTFIFQFLSILLCFITFFNLTMKYDLKTFFKIYLQSAFLMSIIAIIQECIGVLGWYSISSIPVLGLLTKNYGSLLFLVKTIGLFREPSFLAYFLCPATFFALAKFFLPEKIPSDFEKVITKAKAVVIICAYILTFSLTGYIGLLLMFLMIWYAKGVSITKLVLPLLAIVIAYSSYIAIPDIQVRVDDTVNAFLNLDSNTNYDSMNLSTFTYYSNYKVMKDSLVQTNFIGAGLGGCSNMYDQFNLGGWSANQLMLNREDANSMLFRILIEFGIPGIIAVFIFLKKFYTNRYTGTYVYSTSCFVLFCMLLLRQGNYTHGGIILFVCFYYKAYLMNKNINQAKSI